jgi:hypothetical protein
MLITGRCQARSDFHASCKGMNGPQLAVGILGSGNTRLLRGLLLGNVPTRSEAFPALFVHRATLPKAVDWLPVPSLRKIARTVANMVVFLPAVLHGGTGKHDFVVQGTRTSLLYSAQNVKRFGLPGGFFASRRAQADTRLTPGVETAGACGGLKPSPVSRWLPAFAQWVDAPPPAHISEQEARETAGEDAVYRGTKFRGASNRKAATLLNFRPRRLQWLNR